MTRVEVISANGREFVGYFEPGAYLAPQDDDRALKVFVGESSGRERR